MDFEAAILSAKDGFLYLTDEVMASLNVTTEEAIASIEHLLKGQAKNQVWSNPKSAATLPDGRYIMTTLAAAANPQYFAVKQLVLNPSPVQSDLKQINGVITLLDSATGLPLAFMDGNWITAIRTAGLSAVAAKRMARADSRIVAFIGCGVQAHSHLQAFLDMFPLEEIRAFGRGAANRDKLCEAAELQGLKAVASPTGQAAIEGADLIVTSVTLSSSVEPFLDARGVKSGAFAAITDFALPWVKDSLLTLDRVMVDDVEQEIASGSPVIDPSHMEGSLQDLVTGDIPPRENDTDRIAFMFRGLAVGDLALAGVAYQKALAAGAGVQITT